MVDVEVPFGGVDGAAGVEVDPQFEVGFVAGAGVFLGGEAVEGAGDGRDHHLFGDGGDDELGVAEEGADVGAGADAVGDAADGVSDYCVHGDGGGSVVAEEGVDAGD